MNKNEILQVISLKNLDIRERGPLPRPFDQKLTPDVLNTIAKVILTFNTPFTNRNIQESETLKEIVVDIFGKPNPKNITVANEYDKFIGQITNHLLFVGILEQNGSKMTLVKRRLLDYIALSWENSLRYLIVSIEAILKESGIINVFMEYIYDQRKDKNSYIKLRDFFVAFYQKYTNVKKPLEPRRIVAKVLNPLAYEYRSCGSKKGSVSKEKILMRDLMYSTVDNSRDFAKKRSESRNEYKSRVSSLMVFSDAQVSAMKKYVKEIYGNLSAISGESGLQVHHIMMESAYPMFRASPENLIPLTAQEHTQKAHPNGDFSRVDIEFQKFLLKRQRKTIVENPDKFDINVFNTMLELAEITID